tara:strand:- start:65 stop:538 length:474 start_codon:yes stop_codon:yes gene_type:complete
MALTDKKYSAVHNKTGSDKARLETQFNEGHIHTFTDLADNGNPEFGALIYQIQEMQDELDYLRTEISANKDKTGISSSQASAITANEKAVTSHATSITGLTSDMKAVQTNLTVGTESGITAKFENLKAGLKGAAIDLKITDNTGKTPKTYKATITLQ